MSKVKLFNMDCLEFMKSMPDKSVDTCITDPPYELGFMGKKWDNTGIAFQVATWREVYRVLKPGAILLAFGGTRTYHRMVCAIEDAGFEIRDTIAWVYGSGFPKSLDIGKAIDKKAGAEREVVGVREEYAARACKNKFEQFTSINPSDKGINSKEFQKHMGEITAPSTPEAQLWDGWGTALKPAFEPIVVAMKPIDGTFVNNALTWGVAGLWIDGGRVATSEVKEATSIQSDKGYWHNASGGVPRINGNGTDNPQGRFPANFVHDGSDEVVGLFPQSKSTGGSGEASQYPDYSGNTVGNYLTGKRAHMGGLGDSGSAARFFMTCKQDDLCSLCLTPKHSIMSNIDNSEVIQCKSLFANNVEKSLTTTQATTLNIAQESVQDWLIEKAVHFVKYVGNLCDSCAMSIVREVVEIKTWDSKNVASPVIRDFIGNSNKCILIQSLAQYAEIWDSIDTTPTTTSLLTLFGYASRVITNYIQETEKTAPKRFLYSPKASRAERNAGLEGISGKPVAWSNQAKAELKRGNLEFSDDERKHNKIEVMQNHHPTVKPLKLMRYLVRLTKTPTGGVVLDPFMGSGTTGVACVQTGRNFIGCEINKGYFEIAQRRINEALAQGRLPLGAE